MSAPEKDLFGDDIPPDVVEPVANPTKKRRKTTPKGYAAPPGGGPKGETCKTCEHYCRVGGHSKAYRKCGLVRARWTNGPGTDILAKSPACAMWKKWSKSE